MPRDARWSAVGSALWRGRWLVAAATLAGALAGSQLGVLTGETWTAQSRIVMAVDQDFLPLVGAPTDPKRFLATRAALVTSGPVLERATELLDEPTDVGTLVQSVQAVADKDQDVIRIVAEGPTAEAAADRAEAVGRAYRAFSLAQVTATADVAAEAVAGDPAAVAGIRGRAEVYGDGVALIEPAAVPDAPTSPDPVRDVAALAVLGLLVGAALALVLGPRPPGVPEIAERLDAPLLGEIELAGRGRALAAPSPDAARIGALALADRAAGRPGALMLTGAEGVTTAVALGVARALAPRRVAVVHAAAGGGAGLFVLDPDGRPASRVRRSELAQLGDQHDLVLLCTGPVDDDPVAFGLLAEASSVVLVADATVAVAGQLDGLRRRLTMAGRRCDGVLAVRRPGGLRSWRRRPAGSPASSPRAGWRTGSSTSPGRSAPRST